VPSEGVYEWKGETDGPMYAWVVDPITPRAVSKLFDGAKRRVRSLYELGNGDSVGGVGGMEDGNDDVEMATEDDSGNGNGNLNGNSNSHGDGDMQSATLWTRPTALTNSSNNNSFNNSNNSLNNDTINNTNTNAVRAPHTKGRGKHKTGRQPSLPSGSGTTNGTIAGGNLTGNPGGNLISPRIMWDDVVCAVRDAVNALPLEVVSAPWLLLQCRLLCKWFFATCGAYRTVLTNDFLPTSQVYKNWLILFRFQLCLFFNHLSSSYLYQFQLSNFY
jgi:hypothetical protein